MSSSSALIRDWYGRFKRHISSIALFGGFFVDTLTLRRVDMLWENFLISLHIIIVATCIILINLKENDNIEDSKQSKVHFWLINIMQFSFGGLLSAFLIFYFRSATLAVSWPFLLLLVVAFIANESFKKHYERLVFQISFLYLSLLSFAIFIVPVFFHKIGSGIFLLSGLTSLLVLGLFIFLLKTWARENFLRSKKTLIASIASIFFLVNILYFFNLIPPIPLALKDAGVYHYISRDISGNYLVQTEEGSWRDYFRLHPIFHKVPGESVYVYSAIFSPTAFQTGIVHEWQKYDKEEGWQTVNLVPLKASGGREGGYRTYSLKSDASAGKWRVNVKTMGGQTIGRLRFNVALAGIAPTLATEVK